jgi:hypothetical protein
MREDGIRQSSNRGRSDIAAEKIEKGGDGAHTKSSSHGQHINNWELRRADGRRELLEPSIKEHTQ